MTLTKQDESPMFKEQRQIGHTVQRLIKYLLVYFYGRQQAHVTKRKM